MPISNHNIGSFEARISIDIQQTFFFFCNNVSIVEDKFFATDFLRFFSESFQKKRKKSCLWPPASWLADGHYILLLTFLSSYLLSFFFVA